MVKLVVTCEHASNAIPSVYQTLIPIEILETHRGFDIGASCVAREIASAFKAPLVEGEVSRLLVDLNRSENNPSLFSEYTKGLDCKKKLGLMEKYYYPYRQKVLSLVENLIAKEEVLHLSVHSFTPILHGKKRRADIGLLYDPKRAYEVGVCKELRRNLKALTSFSCLMNSPYKGISDGLVTELRGRVDPERYIGIEIEINQKLYLNDKASYFKKVVAPLIEAVDKVLGEVHG